jgi:hypothetical protein
LQARLLPAGPGALPFVQATVPRDAEDSACSGALADPSAFAAHIAPLRKSEWVVYAKAPFGGPEAVLAYLSRYTHRVASPSAGRIIAPRDAPGAATGRR